MSESKKPEQKGTTEADKQKDAGAAKGKKDPKAPKEEELVRNRSSNLTQMIE